MRPRTIRRMVAAAAAAAVVVPFIVVELIEIILIKSCCIHVTQPVQADHACQQDRHDGALEYFNGTELMCVCKCLCMYMFV